MSLVTQQNCISDNHLMKEKKNATISRPIYLEQITRSSLVLLVAILVTTITSLHDLTI